MITSDNRVWSFWDMLEVDAGRFFGSVSALGAYVQVFSSCAQRQGVPRLPQKDFDMIQDEARNLRSVAEELNLPMTAAVCEEFISEIDELVAPDDEGMVSPCTSLFVRMMGSLERIQSAKYEARSKLFLALNTSGNLLWQTEPPFGQAAQDAFPSSSTDIEEAAKCLAVERGTACVMHLMRAIEVPLKSLATSLNVGQQNDWGSYIREIDKELGVRMKAAGKRSQDEQFFAETSEAFERVKRAWRNRTMHVDAVYTVERAREIYDATKDFLAYLAPKIHE